MPKYFNTPFAENGDRDPVPEASVDGEVSFDTGYTTDYELPKTNTNRKAIERRKNNGLYHGITENLKFWQENGAPEIVADSGAGSPLSYSKGFVGVLGGVRYVSLVDGTTTVPPSAEWEKIDLSTLNQSTIYVGSVAAMDALSPIVGSLVKTLGYYSPGDGGGNDYEIVAGATGAEDGGSFINLTNGNQAKGLFFGGVQFEQFGATGDGIADDVSQMQAAAAFSEGRHLRGMHGKVYRMTGNLTLEPRTTLDLGGAKILFNVDGAEYNLRTNDASTVRNGTVENAGTNPTSNGGFQCPITVGEFSAFYTFFRNVTLDNLEIISNRPDGNGILVTSDSRNVKITNIKFPDSAFMGRPILCHWGAQGAASNGLKHPKNIEIDNIRIGSLTRTASAVNGIFISACSDVTVTNVEADLISNGAIVHVFAGDYGYQYGTQFEQDYGAGGIDIKNIKGTALYGVQTNLQNDFDTIKIWPSIITIKNVGAQSSDKTAAINAGVRLANVNNVTVSRSHLFKYKFGMYFDDNVSNVLVKNTKLTDNDREGVALQTTGNSDIEFYRCSFERNNQLGLASIADVRVDRAVNVKLRKNTYDSPACQWNVRLGTGASAPDDVQITGERSRGVSATGPAFSLGGSSDDKICTLFRDNQVENVPSNGIVGGQIFVPYSFSSRSGSGNVNFRCFHNAVPATGAWQAGDRVDNTAPTVDANNMIVEGWICTVSGSPGTWVARQVSTVSPAV